MNNLLKHPIVSAIVLLMEANDRRTLSPDEITDITFKWHKRTSLEVYLGDEKLPILDKNRRSFVAKMTQALQDLRTSRKRTFTQRFLNVEGSWVAYEGTGGGITFKEEDDGDRPAFNTPCTPDDIALREALTQLLDLKE